MTRGAEGGVTPPRARGCRQPPEAEGAGDTACPLEPLQGTQPC